MVGYVRTHVRVGFVFEPITARCLLLPDTSAIQYGVVGVVVRRHQLFVQPVWDNGTCISRNFYIEISAYNGLPQNNVWSATRGKYLDSQLEKDQIKFENDYVSRNNHRIKTTQPNLIILVSCFLELQSTEICYTAFLGPPGTDSSSNYLGQRSQQVNHDSFSEHISCCSNFKQIFK